MTSIVHLWNVPGYITDAGVLGVGMLPSVEPFMLVREDVLENSNIISSLSFTVFPDLDGVTITCSDSTAVAPETQTLTPTVLGKTMVALCVCI